MLTYIVFFARTTLLIVFAAAVFGKTHSRAAWAAFVAATGTLLGLKTGSAWAIGAVLFESLTLTCLAFNNTAYLGLVLAVGALTSFFFVVLIGVIRRVKTSCNCFGSNRTALGWTHVVRNAALLCVAASGWTAATRSKVPSMFVGSSYATPVVLSLVVAAVFVMWDDMIYLTLGKGPEA